VNNQNKSKASHYINFLYPLRVTGFLLFFVATNSHAQTYGIGYSSYYKDAIDEGKARNEALLNAQKNALITYGGYMKIESHSESKEVTTGSNNNFQSDFKVAARQLMNAMVKTTSEPRYEYKQESNKKKYIVASGYFTIDIKEIEDLASIHINATGNKIAVELHDMSNCEIYPTVREYFNRKQNNFRFADKNHIFKTTHVFVINVYKNYLEFTKKQINQHTNQYEAGPILKTFLFTSYSYKNCQDFISDFNNTKPNGLFDELMNEFYTEYNTENINDF
jgi:hypothetical protein